MSTVLDRSGNSPGLDKPFNSPNRKVTSTPVNALTPAYAGEIVSFYSSADSLTYLFKAVGLTNTDWVRLSPAGQSL